MELLNFNNASNLMSAHYNCQRQIIEAVQTPSYRMVDETNEDHKKPTNAQKGMPATVWFGDVLGEWDNS